MSVGQNMEFIYFFNLFKFVSFFPVIVTKSIQLTGQKFYRKKKACDSMLTASIIFMFAGIIVVTKTAESYLLTQICKTNLIYKQHNLLTKCNRGNFYKSSTCEGNQTREWKQNKCMQEVMLNQNIKKQHTGNTKTI